MRSIENINSLNILKQAGMLFSGLTLLIALLAVNTSCTDIEGEGNDSLIWEGASLPEESSYWNPVWEPDLSNPSVFRGATQFFAFGDEKEISEGLNFNVPVLRSGNLMNWSLSGEAFTAIPSWAEGPVTAVSGLFAKTLSTYYLAYTLDNSIGIAYSKAPQGPYIDFGKVLDPAELDLEYCRHPLFIQAGLKFYMFFESSDGIYGMEMNVVRNATPSPKGSIFKIAGSGFTGVQIYRKASDDVYFFATFGSGNEALIKVARAENILGPYLDKNGNDVLSGNGTDLILSKTGSDFMAPSQVGGIFTDYENREWILYQVTDVNKPILSTGAERHPMMLNRISWDEDGWPAAIIEATKGWQKPKFILSI